MQTRASTRIRATAIAVFALTAAGSVAVLPAHAQQSTDTFAWSFNTCGQTGRSGPSQDKCLAANSGDAWRADASQYAVRDGIQYWTAPLTATYSVTLAGAQSFPGRGAKFTTHIPLNQGQQVKILVGQEGRCSYGCGGGGGTFLATSDNAPLAVAGGGGARGGEWNDWRGERGCGDVDARLNTRGGRARDGWNACGGGFTSASGVEGQGGSAVWCSTGGGGFFGDGATTCWNPFRGGQSFVNGGLGGWSQCNSGDGGFGGGGAAHGCNNDWGAGGGGGYAGGSSAADGANCSTYCRPRFSGGGGSFTTGTMSATGYNEGPGFLRISLSGPSLTSATSTGTSSARIAWAPEDAGIANQGLTLTALASYDDGTTWQSVAAGIDPLAGVADLSGFRCAHKAQFALTYSPSHAESTGVPSAAVLIGSEKLNVCPANPVMSIPGQQVTVTIVGATPKANSVGTGFAKLNVGGATVNVAIDADGVGSFTYTPSAGGRAKVAASFASLSQKTNRLSTATATGYVWTTAIRVPRTAVVGRNFVVTATYVTPGETLTLHTPVGDTSATADSSGKVTLTGTFDQVGLQNATVLWGDKVFSSSTVSVAKGR